MSSRNQYLDAGERATAVEIHRSLLEMRAQAARGLGLRAIEDAARARLEAAGFALDYAEIRRADLTRPKDAGEPGLLALVAARLGRTRLIDNLAFDEGG
jgi:pantoate--beta-alanine ligase